MELESLLPTVEAILFTAERPMSTARLKEVFSGSEGEEVPTDELITQALTALKEKYQQGSYGFELREAQGGYHFTTKAEHAIWIQKYQQTKPFRVGRSALEVLAVIAYRQPVTRAEVDQVRGIDSSHLLRVLMERGLVKMAGKAEVPGRPVQYATTPKFLETVGLQSLGELPPLSELDQLQGDTEDPMKSLEVGLDRLILETRDASELQAADNQGLNDIDTLIQSAQDANREVFASKDHAEVAKENQLAVEGLLAFLKPIRRKKTMTFDEVNAGTDTEEMLIVPQEAAPPDLFN